MNALWSLPIDEKLLFFMYFHRVIIAWNFNQKYIHSARKRDSIWYTLKYPLSKSTSLQSLSSIQEREMVKNRGFSRIDYLSLNLKDIKNQLEPGQRTQFAVAEDDVERYVEHTSWVLSTSNQVAVSRNKIGRSLLKLQRHEFLLDDPYMNCSRFFVDYHRLQDPGLRRYFKSKPVRKRLEELCMVSKENDAICSTRELAEYLRYLDRLRSLHHGRCLKRVVCIIQHLTYTKFFQFIPFRYS